MRNLEELEKIVNTTMGGPLLSVAAKELVKWCKAYRLLAATIHVNKDRGLPIYDANEEDLKLIDEEARRVAEEAGLQL